MLIPFVFWLAVAAGPAAWLWGILQLAGTRRIGRFVVAYPLGIALAGAAMLTVGWQWSEPPDAAVAKAALLVVAWLLLLGPVAAVWLVLLVRRWR